MSEPIIQIRNVTKRFGNMVAVDNVSLDIVAGEFFVMLGPSGCGKTTLLRMIAGFELPTEGQILIDGQDMAGVPPNKRPVNMVFQSYAVFPHMSVLDNVGYGMKIAGVPKREIRERAEESLALVKLDGLGARMPDQLSGGQRQRVALARSLVMRPKVLLLDEPLSALDAKLRAQMQFELADLQDKVGITFVTVTHDQDEALSISDRIAVLNSGRIEQFSTPQELYDRPETEYVANFIGSLNHVQGGFSDGRIVDGTEVVGIRPEDVIFSKGQVPGSYPATVELVVPRGHFSEVYLKRADAELRAFISSDIPAVGTTGYARVSKALIYKDGKLVRVA